MNAPATHHHAIPREQAKTDRDAAWELSEAEIDAGLRQHNMAASAHHRAGYRDAWAAMNRIPRLRAVPVPVEFVEDASDRAYLSLLSPERRAELAWPGDMALTDVRRDRDGRVGG